jgi:hypothetical protein
VTGADGVARTRVQKDHQRKLSTVFGEVTVTRMAYRAPGTANLYPADGTLNLPEEKHSHGLRRLAAIESARGSFELAVAAVERATGTRVGKRQLQQLAQAAAVDVDVDVDVDSFYARQRPGPRPESDLLVLTADAKGIDMLPEAPRETTRKTAAGTSWRPGSPRGRRPAASGWPNSAGSTTPLELLDGRAADVTAGIRRRATRCGYSPAERKGADEAADYLTNKKPYLRYDQALQDGWPVATGIIEGACRHIVKDRLDLTGARWGLAGAILTLRALLANGDFDRYRDYHLQQQHQRVHRSRYRRTSR